MAARSSWSDCAPGDLLVLTADHGNDPTTPSTDHSREYVPLLVYGPRAPPRPAGNLGTRATLADVGETAADEFPGTLRHAALGPRAPPGPCRTGGRSRYA
jgi:phosphopentomutase